MCSCHTFGDFKNEDFTLFDACKVWIFEDTFSSSYQPGLYTMQEPSYLGQTTLAWVWFSMVLTQLFTHVYNDSLTLTHPPNIKYLTTKLLQLCYPVNIKYSTAITIMISTGRFLCYHYGCLLLIPMRSHLHTDPTWVLVTLSSHPCMSMVHNGVDPTINWCIQRFSHIDRPAKYQVFDYYRNCVIRWTSSTWLLLQLWYPRVGFFLVTIMEVYYWYPCTLIYTPIQHGCL